MAIMTIDGSPLPPLPPHWRPSVARQQALRCQWPPTGASGKRRRNPLGLPERTRQNVGFMQLECSTSNFLPENLANEILDLSK